MSAVRVTLAALTLAAAPLAAAAPAHAILSEQKFTAAASSNIAGTKARPKPIALKVRAYFDDIAPDLDRQVQFALARASVYFPVDGHTNGSSFPSCDPGTIMVDEQRCPAGSRVGGGHARGIGLGLDERVTIDLFNAARGAGVHMLVVGSTPLVIREIVTGKLTRLSGDPRYGYRIDFEVPRNLQSPAPGVIAAVKEVFVSVPLQYARRGGRYLIRSGRRVPYIATTGCTGGSWYAKFVGEYTTTYDGAIESRQTVEVNQPCWRAGER